MSLFHVQQTHPGPLGEIRAVSTAAGGTSLSTAAAYVALPQGTAHLLLTARNFSTAVVAQILKNPYLVVLRTQDNLATATDYSEAAQDGDASTEVPLDDQDTAANGDYLYVGSHVPFAGVSVDVSADSNEANGTESVLTVNYWNGAWASISATDNTKSGSTSLAQDGTVTWTVPTAWKLASLIDIANPVPGAHVPQRDRKLYWTRWQWSVALDALVRLDAMLAINRSTAYWEMIANQSLELRCVRGVGADGCIQAKCNDGTASLIVNVATRPEELFG